ncbi:MAG: S8 family peptidase [Brevundimonas sp.]|uniref:S8 family peptidase n=1 Tax=Brevundimonas sp. TaxID=1871086 RepID=UPI003919E6C3
MKAWEAGATGAGVRVAVIDSGIDFSQADLQGRISAASTDVIAGRNAPQGGDDHGTRVSGVIASNFNGFGTIGVAYQSTIVSIRADISDCEEPEDDVCFQASDLTRAIDYAIAQGVPVVNMSLGGSEPMGGAFEAALARAINAGIVFTIAAGNEGGESPEWPGRYATDPRYAGGIIVVGAHNSVNEIAGFSNRAGVSAASYLSAAGVGVVAGCDQSSCWRVNGTSFSAPAVAGALALLLQAFPNLSGKDAVAILLTTAREAGDPGVDPVYGRGLLDIAQAFQPVGTTSVPMTSGATLSVTTQQFSYTGAAFGDALRTGAALTTVGRDAFDRLFRVDLGAAYGAAPRADRARLPGADRRQATLSLATPLGGRLSLTSGVAIDDEAYDPAAASHALTPWLDEGRRDDVMVEYSAGAGAVAVWRGRNGARSPFELGAADGFATLAQVDRAWLGAVRLGALTLTADAGVGDRPMPFEAAEQDVSRYTRFALDWQAADAVRMTFAGGDLSERMGPLGAFAPVGSGFEMPSETAFAAVSGRFRLAPNLWLDAEAGWARTGLSGQFMALSEAAISSNWRFGLSTVCSELGLGCRSLTWSISQPLRVESGQFSAWLADAPLAYFDPLTFSERRFSASPTGRQIDLALGSLHQLPDGSHLSLRAVVTRDDRHVRDAAPAVGVTGQWRTTF